ncbi:MAG: hypothetical protein KGN36_16095, partial [Acidobacteriota bacterium]|nr:hypothetical protein [Acidobacteriota bacterium]
RRLPRMKKIMAVMLGLSLWLPSAGIAQTGGDKKPVDKFVKKGHKGGKKSKKGSGQTTTPPPK